MPTWPNIDDVRAAYSPGTLMQYFRANWVKGFLETTTPEAIDLEFDTGDWQAMPAVFVRQAGDVNWQAFVLLYDLAEPMYTAKRLLTSPGFSGVCNIALNHRLRWTEVEAEDYFDAWRNMVDGFRDACLVGFADGAPLAWEHDTRLAFDDRAFVCNSAGAVVDGANTSSANEVLVISNNAFYVDAEGAMTGAVGGMSVLDSPGASSDGAFVGSIGVVSGDCSRIAAALEDISQMRTEISVNNGAAMYSVSGGTRSEG